MIPSIKDMKIIFNERYISPNSSGTVSTVEIVKDNNKITNVTMNDSRGVVHDYHPKQPDTYTTPREFDQLANQVKSQNKGGKFS